MPSEPLFLNVVCNALHPDLQFVGSCIAWFQEAISHCEALNAKDFRTFLWVSLVSYFGRSEIDPSLPMSVYPNKLTRRDCSFLVVKIGVDYMSRAPKYIANVELAARIDLAIKALFVSVLMITLAMFSSGVASIVTASMKRMHLKEKSVHVNTDDDEVEEAFRTGRNISIAQKYVERWRERLTCSIFARLCELTDGSLSPKSELVKTRTGSAKSSPSRSSTSTHKCNIEEECEPALTFSSSASSLKGTPDLERSSLNLGQSSFNTHIKESKIPVPTAFDIPDFKIRSHKSKPGQPVEKSPFTQHNATGLDFHK